MGRDERSETPMMYHPEELRAWSNSKKTEHRIYHAKTGKLLWSGSSLHAAEFWLQRHLIPPTMPANQVANSVANAFKSSA